MGPDIRAALGEALLEQAASGTPAFLVTADLVIPLRLGEYAYAYPQHVLDVGVAEQAMVTIAAGVASVRRPVVAATFAVFLLRAYEPIRNLLVADRIPVTLVGAHAGIATGPNGGSHHAVEDINVLTGLPGMLTYLPATGAEVARAVMASFGHDGPSYIRIPRWIPDPAGEPSAPGQRMAVDAAEVVVFGHGATWCLVEQAVAVLQGEGLPVAAAKIGSWPSVEPLGGGQARLRVLCEDASPGGGLLGLLRAALPGGLWAHVGPDWAMGSDDAEVLYERAGLTVPAIADRVREEMRWT
jgi:transketolase